MHEKQHQMSQQKSSGVSGVQGWETKIRSAVASRTMAKEDQVWGLAIKSGMLDRDIIESCPASQSL